MKRFLVIALVIFALILALIALIFLGIRVAGPGGRVSLSEGLVLELDLEAGFLEYRSPDPFDAWLNGDAAELFDIVRALDRAAGDDRVDALIANVGNVPAGLAQLQELRDAVRRFAASGKRTVAWAETFGEAGPGNGSFYLATAFDEIYLQPSGDVGLNGLMYEIPFVAKALDKIDVDPLFDQRHEYKNAVDTYMNDRMTASHEEAMQALVDSQFDQVVVGISEGLDRSPDDVRGLFDRGPYLGEEAVREGLVDALRYRDEVYADVLGDDRRLLYLQRYRQSVERGKGRGARVALIHGVGGVVRGASGLDPLTGERVMGSASVSAAFRAARRDGTVKAILFRVDSPGGSYVASDTVYREVLRASEDGIPVVVSMGNLAASGGYFVSMPADRIVAQPGTITGSIGVYGGKFYTREMWRRLGVTWDHVQTGPHATLWNASERRSAGEEERFQAALDRIYEDFTAKVGESRGLERDRVHDLARGRVWTGADAHERGLVDTLGGFAEALDEIRSALDLEPDAPLSIRRYPRQKTAWQALFAEAPDHSDDFARSGVRRLQRRLSALAEAAAALGLDDPDRSSTPVRDPRLSGIEGAVR